jgi:hypothetical protein
MGVEDSTGLRVEAITPPAGNPPPLLIPPAPPLPLPLKPLLQDHLAVRHEKDSRVALCKQLKIMQRLAAIPQQRQQQQEQGQQEQEQGQQQQQQERECSASGLVVDVWSPAGGLNSGWGAEQGGNEGRRS